MFTPDDPALPRDLVTDPDGQGRFAKYLPADRTFVNFIENYPYPYVVNKVPVVIGYLLKYEAMAAFLMVATIVGLLMALVLNNSGGAWDNVKKFIETGEDGGKGSDAHKAAVVGDTVGDPFKDTAGPSLHVLVKLLATTALVLAPLYI